MLTLRSCVVGVVAVLVVVTVAGCGGDGVSLPDNPFAPTPASAPSPTPSPTPTPEATRIIGLSGTMAFGDVQVGTSATTTLTISNSGNSLLTWSGLSTGNGVFTASATSGTVAAGGSANVTLTFTPSSVHS